MTFSYLKQLYKPVFSLINLFSNLISLPYKSFNTFLGHCEDKPNAYFYAHNRRKALNSLDTFHNREKVKIVEGYFQNQDGKLLFFF